MAVIRVSNLSFEIQESIGEGTFANVYRGNNIKTGELVALKVIKSRAYTNNKDRDSEIKHLGKLPRHPNLLVYIAAEHRVNVKIGDTTMGSTVIVSNLGVNGDLYSLIERESRLSEPEAKKYFTQVNEVFMYACMYVCVCTSQSLHKYLLSSYFIIY